MNNDLLIPFRLFTSATLEFMVKGADASAEERGVAPFVAIVSARGKDQDGEDVSQVEAGTDYHTYFQKHGWFNYEHQQGPDNLVGYPLRNDPQAITPAKDAEGRDATRVVGELLLNTSKGRGIYEVANNLQKSGQGGQIGFSIEGAYVKRDDRDRNRVLKAFVKNIAITAHPKHLGARLELIKGDVDPSFASSLGYQSPPEMSSVGDLSPLLTQSLDGTVADATTFSGANGGTRKKKKLTKGQVLDILRKKYPGASDASLCKAADFLLEKNLV